MTEMTTIRVVVAVTTPSKVRKERSLCARSASMSMPKASRAVTQKPPSLRGFTRGVRMTGSARLKTPTIPPHLFDSLISRDLTVAGGNNPRGARSDVPLVGDHHHGAASLFRRIRHVTDCPPRHL